VSPAARRRRILDQTGGVQIRNEPVGEVLGGEHADVVAVDRLGLLLVEAGGIGVHVDDVERGDELLEENTSRSAAIDQPSSAR
jgi:hypothetical protein